MYKCTYIPVYTHTHTRRCRSFFANTHVLHIHTHTYIQIHRCIYIQIHVCTYIHIHIYKHVRIHVYIERARERERERERERARARARERERERVSLSLSLSLSLVLVCKHCSRICHPLRDQGHSSPNSEQKPHKHAPRFRQTKRTLKKLKPGRARICRPLRYHATHCLNLC